MSAGDLDGTILEISTPRNKREREALLEVGRSAIDASKQENGVPEDSDVGRHLIWLSIVLGKFGAEVSETERARVGVPVPTTEQEQSALATVRDAAEREADKLDERAPLRHRLKALAHLFDAELCEVLP